MPLRHRRSEESYCGRQHSVCLCQHCESRLRWEHCSQHSLVPVQERHFCKWLCLLRKFLQVVSPSLSCINLQALIHGHCLPVCVVHWQFVLWTTIDGKVLSNDDSGQVDEHGTMHKTWAAFHVSGFMTTSKQVPLSQYSLFDRKPFSGAQGIRLLGSTGTTALPSR